MEKTDTAKIKDERHYAPRTSDKYSSDYLGRDAEGETVVLSCNEAIARGAIEAGLRFASSYPGSPLQYVIDSLASAKRLYPSMHVEWSTNEKCAFEGALGAAVAGLRSICIMKNMGVNWLVDPLTSCVARGVQGLVIASNDDPNAETTMNCQDSRYIARYNLVPVLEPATMQEVKDYTAAAFELSETLCVPVFVRVNERMGWSREPVVLGKVNHQVRERKAQYSKNDPWHWKVEKEKLPLLEEETPRTLRWEYLWWFKRFRGEATPEIIKETGKLPTFQAIQKEIDSLSLHSFIGSHKARLGIISAGSYAIVDEAINTLGVEGDILVLKPATPYPLPVPMVEQMLREVETVLVVEEIEPFIEEQVKIIAADMDKHARILGKLTGHIPFAGEIDCSQVGSAIARILDIEFKANVNKERISRAKYFIDSELKLASVSEAARNCPGCPSFAALFALKTAIKRMGISTFGFVDAGCHSMCEKTPLELGDICYSMGTSIGSAHGFSIAAPDRKVISIIGDSTFFHAGMPALANAVYNRSNLLICVLDNGTTAMTGHQPHPGAFGITASGEPTKQLDVKKVAKALGADYVAVVDPYDQEKSRKIFEKALKRQGVSVVIARRICALVALRQRGAGARTLGDQPHINLEKCLSWTVEKAPCEAACPVGINVESYVQAISRANFGQALDIIKQAVPFPSILGRVCHHPCEASCKRGKLDEPVCTKALKRFAADWADGAKPEIPPITKAQKVAIVGAGSAGLMAAYELRSKGYQVTIFEASPFIGGMMKAGIPEYRLPRDILNKELDIITGMGVEIKLNTRLGQDVKMADLRNDFDAVFLAVGTQLSQKLNIDGNNLEGIALGVDFMRKVNLGMPPAVKERVVVIGGGNVAVDAARSALRLGAKEVQIACLESREEMPAFPYDVQQAIEEGVVLKCSWGPKRILGDGKKVTGIELMRCLSVFDATGEFHPTFDMAKKITVKADMVIVAIGQTADLTCLDGLGNALAEKGLVKVDPVTLQTSIPKVFAGGDVVSGPKSVVEALAAGRKAAFSIDRYLTGKDLEKGSSAQPPFTGIESVPVVPTNVVPGKRAETPFTLPETRITNFDEVELGFTKEAAIQEAKRCLKCKSCNFCIKDYGCIGIGWTQNKDTGKLSPQIDKDICVGCHVCTQICPLGAIELGEGLHD